MKNPEDLTDAQRGKLDSLKRKAGSRLFRAWELKEGLRAVFRAGTADDAARLLGAWLHDAAYCKIKPVVAVEKKVRKRKADVIAAVELGIAFASGLVFPFVFGSDYSSIFYPTIAVALFVYYVFSILEQTKKDSLTGLLNRKAIKYDIRTNPKEITALLSIDMNGLKAINDNQGHIVGDDALTTLALCFTKALRTGESGYRIGGDEFAIVGRRISQSEMLELAKRIEGSVEKTEYSCSIGYSYNDGGEKTVEQMLKEADEMMYSNKARYYAESGKDRRAASI